jgi:hypothetical protein
MTDSQREPGQRELGPADKPDRHYGPVLLAGIVGLTLGAAISWALLFGTIDRATPFVDILVHVVLPALGITVGILALVLVLAWRRAKRFLTRTQGTLEQVVAQAAAAAEAAAKRDAPQATHHAGQMAMEAAAWYGPIMARRGLMQASLAVLLAFGGLVGTALLFRQTLLLGMQNVRLQEQVDLLRDQNTKIDRQVALLTEQNSKIDLQTLTAEAQRRGGLAPELFSIMQELSNLEQKPEGPVIKPSLKGRIVAFSRAATPYWTIETHRMDNGQISAPQRAARPRSPERGQLLVGLLLNNVRMPNLQEATFADADLRQANLNDTDMGSMDLRAADLSEANLTRARLRSAALGGANLRGAYLSEADLSNAWLISADLTGASLTRAILNSATLIEANLSGAKLERADLQGANLARVNLRNAIIAGANFADTVLHDADLTGAILGLNREGPPATTPPGWIAYDDGQYFRLSRTPATR